MKKFNNSIDYYAFHIEEFAPYINASAVRDVLAGEELVHHDIDEQYGVGWRLPYKVTQEARRIWLNELIKAIHSISGVEHSTIEDVLYVKDMICAYCGRYEHPKRKRRSVGKNVGKDRYYHYYTVRISAFTGFEENDVEAILKAESDIVPDLLAMYGYVSLLPDFMWEDEHKKMMSDMVEMIMDETGLEESVVGLTLLFKGKVREYCGEPG